METSRPTIEDLEEGILVRIFEHVIGEPCHPWDSVFGRRFEDNLHMEPTCVEGFAHGLVLPQVCRKWEKIVKNYPNLWNKVYVDTVSEQEEGYDEIYPLPTSVCLQWWVNHALNLRSVHLRGHSAGSEGSLGMYNMGLVSLLNASSLKVLHLDDCFENGASVSLIPMLCRLVNLEQLRVMRIDESFVCRLSELQRLSNLRGLELQGMERGVVEMNATGLPSSLESLSLALIGISGMLGPKCRPLTGLKTLKLVHVDWQGGFCDHICCLTNLEGLVINNVFHVDHGEELADWPAMSALVGLKHLEVGGEHSPGLSQGAGEQVIEKLPFPDLTKLCLKFQSQSMALFSNREGQFRNLTHLYLECFSFGSVPESVMELVFLEQLGLVDCELTGLMTIPDQWVENLKLLDISKNHFLEFPRCVTKLRNLTDLNVAHNEAILYESLNFLAGLPELLTLRLLEGECLVCDFDGGDVIESRFQTKTAAYRMGSLFTVLQVKNPNCHLYL